MFALLVLFPCVGCVYAGGYSGLSESGLIFSRLSCGW